MGMRQPQWKELAETTNFEMTAETVFRRLIRGQGPGVIVLWGPGRWGPQRAHKTRFLDAVRYLARKGPLSAKEFVSLKYPKLWQLMLELEAGQYDCVTIGNHLSFPDDYSRPLSVCLVGGLGLETREGFHKVRSLAVICDDLQRYMKWPEDALARNLLYLRELADYLDKQTSVTFIGAWSKDEWPLADQEALDKSGLLDNHVLPLGWGSHSWPGASMSPRGPAYR
jgi:hypothetical protein